MTFTKEQANRLERVVLKELNLLKETQKVIIDTPKGPDYNSDHLNHIDKEVNEYQILYDILRFYRG